MRYCAIAEINYLAGRRPPAADLAALKAAVRVESDRRESIVLLELDVTPGASGVVIVRAVLDGRRRGDLDSPRKAILHLDTAVDDALIRTDLFEQFDVARKILLVAPFSLARRIDEPV